MSTQYSTQDTSRPTRGTSVPHLVAGLVFLGLAGSWGLHEVGVIESVQVQWLVPLILVVAGAAGLLASLTRGVGRGGSDPAPDEEPVEETEQGTGQGTEQETRSR